MTHDDHDAKRYGAMTMLLKEARGLISEYGHFARKTETLTRPAPESSLAADSISSIEFLEVGKKALTLSETLRQKLYVELQRNEAIRAIISEEVEKEIPCRSPSCSLSPLIQKSADIEALLMASHIMSHIHRVALGDSPKGVGAYFAPPYLEAIRGQKREGARLSLPPHALEP